MIIPYCDNNYFLFFPPIPPNCDKPPTMYSILESIVNYGTDEKIKIKDLAKEGRKTIFNFDYPLTSNVDKEEFECMILNKFLMRRIGFDTVTAFRIQLNVKLNEIMPLYNKMFDLMYENYSLGNITIKEGTDNRTIDNTNKTTNKLNNNSTTTTEEISDRRNSELPQNQLDQLRDGSYVSDYNYDQNNGTSTDVSESNGESESNANTKDNNIYNEKITNVDMLDTYIKMKNEIQSIYGMIFKDLECLFYQVI